MNDFVVPVYDPTDAATRRNPFPLYEALQAQDPVHWSPALRSWVVTRYEDVKVVLATPTMSSDRLTPFYASLKDERRDILSGVMRYLNLWLVFKSPPEHTRLRRILNAVFTPAVVAAMEPGIRATFEHILAGLEPRREMDFMKEVAVLLPAYVILDMMNVPREDFPRIKVWSDWLRLFIGTSQGEGDKYRMAREGADRMSDYFRAVIARRRSEPGDDIISRMVAVRDEAGGLSEDELVACCMLILFGGHETTTNLLGSAIAALLQHPDQLQRLHAEPALIQSAIEEFLRYDGPSNSMVRLVATDHALGGKALQQGQRVFAMINAANRDPRQFDQPHALDLGRRPNRHLTFGQGVHFCLGAPLARLEARICIGELVARFPQMRAGSQPAQWIDAMIMRGPESLPLLLD
ncbi:MAG: cytochrome P450 [Rhodoferax sp.]|nr:cytochrome P450 [Rhodoferax sp.]